MKTQLYLKLSLVCAALVVGAATLNAQATRTWVSGVGDDANPCSRTAPCKTFAGAISKTAEGGEISVLDPGGFGTVTITKAMTIEGTHGGGFASILNAGTNGININITTGTHVSDAVVIIRSVYFQGASQSPSVGAINGINYLKANRVFVNDCHFENQGTAGINANLTSAGLLWVVDCDFTNTNTGISLTTTAGSVVAQVEHCSFNGLANGINTTSGAIVTVNNCSFMQTIGANGAVRANSGCQANILNSLLASNNIGANAAGGTVRVSNNDFFSNAVAISGTAESANNNRFRANGADGTTTNVVTVK